MMDILKSVTEDKDVCILGYGREGQSSLKRILEAGTYRSLTVCDKRDVSAELPAGIECVSGDGYQDSLDDFDVVFKTPGVVLNKEIFKYDCEITSEAEIFIEAYRDRIVGITGTKGKSTTSSLMYHVLKEAGLNVVFAGNIGIPVFDIADEIGPDTIVVIELSCHQLEYLKTSPHKAVLLNVYEDHLDHYGTREKYGLAKKNIYRHQKAEDFLFTLPEVTDEWGEAPSKTVFVSADDCPVKSFDDYSEIKLKGAHNLLNAAFVYDVVKDLGVSEETFIKALQTFEPLPHRLEYAGTYKGIDFYDDSISTTVKSAVSAVESIKNSAVLLAGGMERGIEYGELVEYVSKSKLKYLICMYSSGKRIYEMYEALDKSEDAPKAVLVNDLEEAVAVSFDVSKPGDAVLLSPAAASYGYFKNFEERGDIFKNLIKK
ncbi:MAG: UDP-N-acetylmuramoyl-L-alanine--D-glutamate ligase [Lachnospiraceae bacterium]|nr:UDP-N-acetylmuramoyl-L-alanine--D-glutamate ligase [Lachnospiraceae bacterium]